MDARPFTQRADPATATLGAPCLSDDGYDDVAAGTQVVVTGADGATPGLGELGPGGLRGEDGESVFQARCDVELAVLHVPAGEDFYGVSVGRHGVVLLTEAELRSGPVALTLG